MLSLILSALVATSAPLPCSWDHPGINPYKNSAAQASTALKDYAMPASTRAKLKSRMESFDYDEVVTITRDEVTGKKGAYSDMRDMHSGHGLKCKGPVQRTGWEAKRVELGLVYCEDHTCVIVPTICNNVSLITRKDDEESIDISPAAGPGGEVMAAAASTPDVTPSGERETIQSVPAGETMDSSSSPPATVGFIGGGSSGGGGSPTGTPPPGFVGPIGPNVPPVIVPPIITPPVVPSIPEPGTWCLLLAGFMVVLRCQSQPQRR